MHFRRPRRQRISHREVYAFARSYMRHQTACSTIRIPQIAQVCGNKCGWQSNYKTAHLFDYHSRARALRDCPIFTVFLSEQEALNLYFESGEDPFMRTKIAAMCSIPSELKYITEEYLDRMAKIKLFL
jgi:hypothetical protein